MKTRSVETDRYRLLRIIKMRVMCMALACLVSSAAFSQKVSTLLSKDKIVLGEQVMLQVKVEGLVPGSVKQDFSFPDTVNHLEILSDSVQQVGNSAIIHTLTITSFDSGYWQLPAFKLVLDDQRILATEPLAIAVLPVDVSNMQDYHDIKDILEIQPENNWWILACIVLAALVSLFATLWFMSNDSIGTPQPVQRPTDLLQLYQQLIKRLDDLSSADRSNREALALAIAETAQSTRIFTDAAYRQNTAHLTTGEYLVQLKGKLTDATTGSSYFQFLRLADAVKFAKYFPPPGETDTAFAIARQTVTAIYEQNKTVS